MNNARFALAAFASLALLSGCGLAPEEKLAAAEASFAANDYSGAKVYLVSALKGLPGDPDTLYLLARTQIAMGDGDGAIVSLEQIDPEMREAPEWSKLYAESELLRGNFSEALKKLGEPQTADAARIAALAHLGLGDLEAAKEAISGGENLPGNKAGILAAKSQIELGEGQTGRAIATAEEAIQADQNSLDALLAQASASQANDNLPKTLSAYQKAAELFPQSFAAEYGRVAVLAELGRFDEARAGLDNLAETSPKSIDVIHLRARLALEEGKPQRARELLQGHETALRQDPSKRATYATALLRVGQYAQARAILAPLAEEFPGRRELRTLLAEAELASGNPAAALESIKALAERPDARPDELDVAARAAKASGDSSAKRFEDRKAVATPEWIGGELARADKALRNQQWRDAIKSYEAIAARSAQPNAMVLNNLAYAKSKLGQTDDAVSIALKAVDMAPDHPAVLDTAGWILVESGKDREHGIALLEKASRLDPDNAGIARRLAEAKRG